MHKSPLIISGIGRSGTSAVISSMSKHKHVVEPNRVGEAPFINHFIQFLIEYEDRSQHKDYHLKNYQLDSDGRVQLFSNLLSQLQYGLNVDAVFPEKKYWIAKVSLNEDLFQKARSMFPEIRLIYVMRNGVEVVNSAKSFDGFKTLSFEQLCNRWMTNLNECRYVHYSDNCSVIKHDELVVDPAKVYARVFRELGLEQDSAPAEFINSTLFNSSFDKPAKLETTSEVFKKRLECWNEWTDDQKSTFIRICDPLMSEFRFVRPYSDTTNIVTTVAKKITATDVATEKEQLSISQKIEELVLPHMSVPQFDYHANPSPKFDYLFIENPKVASTSTLKILQEYEDADIAERMENSHQRDKSPIPRLSSLSEEQQIMFLESNDIYRFAFVRNPYSRLLSAYLSKIKTPLKPKAEILAVIKGVHKSEIKDLSESIEFAVFANAVCSQTVRQMNVHWKNQIDQIFYGKINYEFVGKFESLQEDISKVEHNLFGRVSNKLQRSKNLTDADAQLAKFYTPDIEEMVYQKFYDDFHAFGYKRILSSSHAA